MKTKTWLRLYHEFADDPKIQMLAFEDQRHYVMVLCLKGRGVIDSGTPTPEYRERMIAKALGLDPLTAREVKFRLMEPGLIDAEWQPVKWDERQFESDSSTERVQKYRDKQKRFGNVSSKQESEPGGQLVDRTGNVSVTAQIRAEQKNSPSGNSNAKSGTPPRAIPSGSRVAPSAEDVERAELAAKVLRSSWSSRVHGQLFNLAQHYGAAAGRAASWEDLTTEARALMPQRCASLIDKAIAWCNDIPRTSDGVIEQMICDELVLELKQFSKRAA